MFCIAFTEKVTKLYPSSKGIDSIDSTSQWGESTGDAEFMEEHVHQKYCCGFFFLFSNALFPQDLVISLFFPPRVSSAYDKFVQEMER